MHTYPFLFEQTTCALRGKASSEEFNFPSPKYLGNTKNKKQGFALPTFQVALVFYFVLPYFDQAMGSLKLPRAI